MSAAHIRSQWNFRKRYIGLQCYAILTIGQSAELKSIQIRTRSWWIKPKRKYVPGKFSPHQQEQKMVVIRNEEKSPQIDGIFEVTSCADQGTNRISRTYVIQTQRSELLASSLSPKVVWGIRTTDCWFNYLKNEHTIWGTERNHRLWILTHILVNNNPVLNWPKKPWICVSIG